MAKKTCIICKAKDAAKAGQTCTGCWKKVNKEIRSRAGLPEEVDGEPDLGRGLDGELAVMRHVLANPEDRTYQERASREWREKDPAGWNKRRVELEAQEKEAEPQADEGEVRCVELCKTWLEGRD